MNTKKIAVNEKLEDGWNGRKIELTKARLGYEGKH